MTDKDFRYEKDGQTIEAFQITKASRYQEKDWPEWMDARWLMTVDGEQWLDHAGNETNIPPLGWICNNPDGTMSVRGAMEMEGWNKVVPDKPKVEHPEARVDEEALLQLGSKLTGRPVEELRAEEEGRKMQAPATAPALSIVRAPVSEDAAELCSEMMQAIRLLQRAAEEVELSLPPSAEEALDYLIHAMAKRTNWCDCAPGICSQADEAGCRINSPLVKSG